MGHGMEAALAERIDPLMRLSTFSFLYPCQRFQKAAIAIVAKLSGRVTAVSQIPSVEILEYQRDDCIPVSFSITNSL